MNKCAVDAVEFGTHAADSYAAIYRSAQPHLDKGDAAHSAVLLLISLNEAIEEIASRRALGRYRLAGRLSHVYGIQRGRLRIFFTVFPKPHPVVILCISTRPISNRRNAEVIIQQMISTGKVRLAIPPTPFIH